MIKLPERSEIARAKRAPALAASCDSEHQPDRRGVS